MDMFVFVVHLVLTSAAASCDVSSGECAKGSQNDWSALVQLLPGAVKQTQNLTLMQNSCESRKPAQKQEGKNIISCGDGCYARQKKVPAANGCGTGKVTLPKTSPFTMACQFHDVCYSRCVDGLLQKQCDDMFYKLMNEIMLEKMPSDPESQSNYLNHEVPQWEAMDMHSAVRGAAGSWAFRKAVDGWCECSAEKPLDGDTKWTEYLMQDMEGKHNYDGMNSKEIYDVRPKVKETIQKLATSPEAFNTFLKESEKWACDREPGATCSTDSGWCSKNKQGYCNLHLKDECTCLPNQCADKDKKTCVDL